MSSVLLKSTPGINLTSWIRRAAIHHFDCLDTIKDAVIDAFSFEKEIISWKYSFSFDKKEIWTNQENWDINNVEKKYKLANKIHQITIQNAEELNKNLFWEIEEADKFLNEAARELDNRIKRKRG